MKKLTLILILILAACAPATQAGVFLPVTKPTDNAYIDPSYPTSQAADVSPNQLSSGVNVRVDRAWRDGKNVNANICFSLPDQSDWSIWSASLTYSGVLLQEYGTTMLSLEPGNERCDTLTFVVPPDADLTSAVITVDSIGTTPRADEYCTVYMPKIQQALTERGIAISLDCSDAGNGLTMKIMSRPSDMSQEQAEQIVYSDEFYTVKGPWVFTFSLDQ